MGMGRQHDEENPEEEVEAEAEKQRLRSGEPEQGDGMELKKIPVRVKDVQYPVILGTREDFIKTSTLKYALLFFNLMIATLGLVLLSLAIWIRADPEFWQYETTLHIKDFYTVCYLFMVAGVVILVVALLGCCGAVFENQGFLYTYIVIFSLIFALEIAGVVLVWSAPYSKTAKQELHSQILKQVHNRDDDESSRYFTDFLQENLRCCGAETHKEYRNEAPKSCQDADSGTIHKEGCSGKLLSYLRQKAGIIAGIALPVLLFQLFALIASGCLIKNVRRESKYVMDS